MTSLIAGMDPVIGAAEPSSGGLGLNFIILILLFAGMWFLIIAPQRKKQKQHDALVKALKSGDSILTNGGIFGTVLSVKEDRVVVKVAENTKIELAKNYVASVLTAEKGKKKEATQQTKKLDDAKA